MTSFVTELAALTSAAVRTARAYERAGSMTARRRVLVVFAATGRRSA